MAAATTESADQDSPSRSAQSEALLSGEAGEKTPDPQTPDRDPVDSEAMKMEVKGEEDGEEGDSKPPVVAPVAEAAAATGDDDEEDEMCCGIEESPEQRSPASCSDAGDGTDKEPKREEMETSSGECIKPDKGNHATEKNCGGRSDAVMGRVSVEMSSSDGEPLSRMDSEDSISSTLMDMESTASSGRSTPAMMNGQGSTTPSSTKSLGYTCCWDQCHAHFDSSPDLAEHIRGLHVDGQRGGVFVCLWKGCKVYNTPSTSQSWLQRHMLSHSGDKPFKCVVGGCNATFASQGGLARHVPTHFSQQNSSKPSNQPKVKEESPSKAGLNKRRKLKNKRRRSLPRPHDFFDAQTMDAIRHRAICLNLATHIDSQGNGHSVVFHSTVIARRKEDSGKVKVLLHWTPEDILPDVWVNETDRPQLKTKVVHLSQLPQDTAVLLNPNIYRMFF
ncbi:zinc finger protein AEBP2-like [Megalops cyprinoides]|uniref:zinc finger protein AEBP2-like n=1 Tax=Megalops cyprinoides TaxID=118141 RepID=UPI0018652371|nr:zinc finger protein AEBP2-like [Megalops cyprinoides]